MTSRATCSLALALSCAMLAACSETATEPQPVAEPSTIHASLSGAAVLSFWQVDPGGAHSCGVASDRRLYCWGWNYNGQIGDGTSGTENSKARPVPVGGPLRFRQVSAGDSHTCAVTTDDVVYCWGWNHFGQLGDGTKSTQRATPAPVAGSHRFRSVDASSLHTCALSATDNRAYCWGANGGGRLGDGTTTERLVPTPVTGSLRFRQVSTGGTHTCGLTTDNRAYCWGENRGGQLGDRTEVSHRTTPTRVAIARTFKQLDAGAGHTCAVATSDSRAFCWGDGRQGALGTGYRYLSFWPRAVAGGLTFTRISAGDSYTCGETTNSRAYCWGWNYAGMLGDGTTIDRLRPVAVKGNHFFAQLSTGGDHTCGKTSESVAYCWGDNYFGQVGDGTTRNRHLTPKAVAGP
jgi:alpha-tubulin suppressor-like RCC1 family protein